MNSTQEQLDKALGSNMESENGSIFHGIEAFGIDKIKKRAEKLGASLSNGAASGCTPENHKVVCEGTALCLELLLVILDVMTIRGKSAGLWAGIGSVIGGLLVGAFMELIKK
jgi:hypothetical protein